MADVSSGVAVAVSATAGVGLTTVFPGVDVMAVLGGFAGAVFFVVFAGDPSFKASLGYLLASWIAGYLFAIEVTARGFPLTPGLSALLGAVVFVIMATGLLDWLKGGKPPFWLRFIPGLGGKKHD